MAGGGLVPSGTACASLGLWQHFGQARAKGVLEGVCLQEDMGARCLLAHLVASIGAVLVPTGIYMSRERAG